MKYKGILIFLIFCIIILSCALITFVILSKDTKNAQSNATISQNTSDNNKDGNNTSENSVTENNIDENKTDDTNTTEISNEQYDKETNTFNQTKKEETTHSEEDSNENEASRQDKQNIALNLTKEEWGEDDTVYYTIDREVNNVYDISVRSKSTTQTLAEYEVDIVNKTVQIK